MFKRNSSFLLLALLGLYYCPSAYAAQSGPNYVVNSATDSNDGVCDVVGTGNGCTLREAINASNTDGSASAITFDATVFANKQTIVLGGTQLRVAADGNLSIAGPTPGVIISGNRANGVFIIGVGANATLTGLTISQGNADSGAGIFVSGSLTIINSTVSGNSARSQGGGIFNSGGTLNVTNCTVSGNSAVGSGGGIYSNTNLTRVITTIVNSTFSGNSAGISGGGVYNFDGLTRIQNSTLANNSAPANSGGGVASFGDDSTSTEVSGSIISANTASDVDFTNSSRNSFASQGGNLIGSGNAIGVFSGSRDQAGVTDPKLGPLANNGGPTLTHAPQEGSPAIDKGFTSLATDQRGQPRPFDDPFIPAAAGGDNSDIGAVELQVTTSAQFGVGVSITPRAPKTFDTLTATPLVADGTGVSFTYTWSVNGVQKQTGTRNTFNLGAPGQGDKGNGVTVVVTATRGTNKGQATNSVTVVNSPPFAFSGTMIVQGGKETLIPFSVAGSTRGGDADGDAITYKLLGGERNATAVFETNAAGRTSLRYTPLPTFFGVDSLRFVATDTDNQTSNIATLSIDVQGSLNIPTADGSVTRAKAGETVDLPLVGRAPNGGPITFKRVGGPVNGTGSITTNAKNEPVFRYTSRSNFGGNEDVRYVALNSQGRPSAPATLRIIVSFDAPPAPKPNNPPTASDVTATTTSGVEVAIPLAGQDPEGAAVSFKRVGGPVNGTGEIRKDTDGVFKMFYLPRANFVGTEVIRFVALDEAGKPSEVATMTVTVNASNVPPASSAMQAAPSSGSS